MKKLKKNLFYNRYKKADDFTKFKSIQTFRDVVKNGRKAMHMTKN